MADSKSTLARDGTMQVTAKEAKTLLGGAKLGDTRQVTKAKQDKKPVVKRTTTIAKTMAEAKVIYGDGVGKRTRSGGIAPAPPVKKPGMKRAGTMQNTAKEGKAYLKRGGKKAKKSAEPIEEKEEEEDAA